MALHVDASNPAAMQLYAAEGYREVSRQTQWESLLEGRSTPLIFMLKRLGAGSGGPAEGGGGAAAGTAAGGGEVAGGT